MNKRLLLILFGVLSISGITAQTQGRIMYVATKNVELKSSTGFFAETVVVLQYGDQVTVVRENGKWREVQPVRQPSLNGWILANSLTSKRIVSGAAASASADELALAGKGFSQEVERSYKKRTSGSVVNYQEIDAMEEISVSRQELYDFLTEGHLNKGDN
ncbi:MAG: hypothetical protein LBT16_10830 [Treponema sp.]|jgi:uncharacterized protein YgiM (DUF1202 family)|nr:hypothetical protein [Treponema sp.]